MKTKLKDLYAIGLPNDRVKIGFGERFIRLGAAKTWHEKDPKILTYAKVHEEVAKYYERLIHNLFRETHLNREIFLMGDKDIEYLSKILYNIDFACKNVEWTRVILDQADNTLALLDKPKLSPDVQFRMCLAYYSNLKNAKPVHGLEFFI